MDERRLEETLCRLTWAVEHLAREVEKLTRVITPPPPPKTHFQPTSIKVSSS